MKQNFIQFKTVSGHPMTLDRFTFTPQARVLTLRLPFGGVVWNRAQAVLVKDAVQTKRYPITNVTRLIQGAIIGAALVFMLISRFMRKRREDTPK
ncbi:MAG: hypothetical protein J0I20_06385 [Chloroflexi bacterium]|nr:hypothetical protein [Chloroflexota bacterium]OJV90218.1 MAG: hypothetical protein BGO39_02325 [Chloroflexi bacterium 54-19]